MSLAQLPEETRIGYHRAIEGIAVRAYANKKTVVMVEIIPSDFKRIPAQDREMKLHEFNIKVQSIFSEIFGKNPNEFEIRTRYYSIWDEEKNKMVATDVWGAKK